MCLRRQAQKVGSVGGLGKPIALDQGVRHPCRQHTAQAYAHVHRVDGVAERRQSRQVGQEQADAESSGGQHKAR